MTETLLVIFLCVLTAVATRRAQSRPQRHGLTAMLGVFALAVPCGFAYVSLTHREMITEPPIATDRPLKAAHGGYVGSEACINCHPQEHDSWYHSYHRSMTQPASAASVVGNFDDVTLTFGKTSLHLTHDEDEFLAEIQMPVPYGDTERIVHSVRPIVMTTGSHHQQSYWFSLDDTTRGVAILPFAFLIDHQRWVPRQSIFLRPRSRVTQYEAGLWNQNCIKCHSTGGLPRANHFIDGNSVYSDRMDTQVAEFGIACESCHGPGERHCRINRDPLRRYRHHLGDLPDDSISNPERMPHRLASQVCGQCHGIFDFYTHESWSRWNRNGYSYRPGDDLTSSRIRFYVNCSGTEDMEGISGWHGSDPKLFWSDGMPRTSGREYNALVRSACFEKGTMSCLSCHQMHQDTTDSRDVTEWANDQLHDGFRRNAACVTCHSDLQDDQSLAAHTQHSPSSSGSNCYNCHMPYTTYGLLKAIRSHEISSPSVSATLQTGRPMACNLCHLDQTLEWSSDWMATWYASEETDLPVAHQQTAASIVWMLSGDAGQRALAAWACGWDDAAEVSGTDWMTPSLAQLLEDPYDAIRIIAERTLRHIRETELTDYDFLDADEDVSRIHRQLLEEWRETPHSSGLARGRRVLLDGDGRLLQEEFKKLLDSRDDTPVMLLE